MSHIERSGQAVAAALSLIAAAVGVVTAVDDADYNMDCSSGRICIYKDAYLAGSLAATCGSCNDADYTNDQYPNYAGGLNDTMSSAVNYRSSGKVLWYPNVLYSGTPFCLDARVAALYVGSSFNDRASSHLSTSGTC
jgi:hypothetical protein